MPRNRSPGSSSTCASRPPAWEPKGPADRGGWAPRETKKIGNPVAPPSRAGGATDFLWEPFSMCFTPDAGLAPSGQEVHAHRRGYRGGAGLRGTLSAAEPVGRLARRIVCRGAGLLRDQFARTVCLASRTPRASPAGPGWECRFLPVRLLFLLALPVWRLYFVVRSPGLACESGGRGRPGTPPGR